MLHIKQTSENMWTLKKNKKEEVSGNYTQVLGLLGAALLEGKNPVYPLPWCKKPVPGQLCQ